jgi:hypothetical protein
MCAVGFVFVLLAEGVVVGFSDRNVGIEGDCASTTSSTSPRTILRELAPRASLGLAAALRERRSRGISAGEDVGRRRGLSVASINSEPVDLMDEDDTASLLSVGSIWGTCADGEGARGRVPSFCACDAQWRWL